MKFCPECNTEYTNDAIVCADCQCVLVDSHSVSAQMDECDNCGGEVDIDSDFCSQCGILFAEDQYSCTNHPTGVAVGVCIVCQKLFCDKCLSKKNNRYYCSDHRNIEASEGWMVAFSSPDFYEARIISGKLENAGITTNSTNTTNIGILADGFMDTALGRTIFRYPIKIFVPAFQYLEAQKIISDDPVVDDNIIC